MRKMSKRIWSVIIVVCLIICLVPVTGAEAKSKSTKKKAKGVLNVPFYETKVFTDERLGMVCGNVGNNCQGYGFVGEDVCKYLQKEISTASEVMAYFYKARYRYDEVIGMMGFVREGWTNSGDPELILANNFGVCCETSTVVAYLLEDDYAEVGFIIVHGDSGHQYNYIKDWDGTYYLVDFTDFTSCIGNGGYGQSFEDDWSKWSKDICFWSGKSLDSKSCKEAACIHDTYEDNNCRSKLNTAWNNEHTGVIFATPDFGTHVPAPNVTDAGYQSNAVRQGLFDGKYAMTTAYYAIQKEAYDKSVVLFTSSKYLGCNWKVVPIDKKYIPWYISDDIVFNDETVFERMERQCRGDVMRKTASYDMIDKNTEIVISKFHFVVYILGEGAFSRLSDKQLKKIYKLKRK